MLQHVMPELISESQIHLNADLHKTDKNFGARDDGAGTAANLAKALIQLNTHNLCNTFLDYGTGKGLLIKRLKEELPSNINVKGYDPAVKQFRSKPSSPVDVVSCLDVLEHIELNNIDAVLQDIRDLTFRMCYLVIDLQPAVKILADGRNAHILLAPQDWWINRISQLFPCMTSFPVMHEAGLAQKLVIAACTKPALTPYMYRFVHQIGAYNAKLLGGILQKKLKFDKKKS